MRFTNIVVGCSFFLLYIGHLLIGLADLNCKVLLTICDINKSQIDLGPSESLFQQTHGELSATQL